MDLSPRRFPLVRRRPAVVAPPLAAPAMFWERCTWVVCLLIATTPLPGLGGSLLVGGVLSGSFLAAAAAALIAAGLCLWRDPRRLIGFAKAAWPCLALLAFTALLTPLAVNRWWSTVRLLTWAPSAAIVFFAAARLSGPDLLRSLMTVLAASMVFSAVAALLLPVYGVMWHATPSGAVVRGGEWTGLYAHKNVLGHAAGIALAVLGAFGRAWLPRMVWVGAMVAAVACLAFAASSTGLIITIVLTVFCFTVLRLRGGFQAVAAGALMVGVVPALLYGPPLMDAALQALGRDLTFSGRTEIWRVAQAFVSEHPLTGSGFNFSGSPEVELRLKALFNIYSVHSAYLDAAINLGWLLCGALAATTAFALLQAWRAPRADRAVRAVSTALVAGCLISGVTEALVMAPSGPMQMLWLAGLFGLFRCAQAMPTEAPSPQRWTAAARRNLRPAFSAGVAMRPSPRSLFRG